MPADYLEIADDQHRRNEAALAAANIGVFEFEPKTERAFWDDRVRQLWGAGPDDFIDYAYVISKVHPEDRDLHDSATAQALDPAGTGEMDLEYRLIARGDQPETWVRARARTLFENGTAVRLVGTVEDITVRKSAQLQNEVLLRELQHRLTNTLAVIGSLVQRSRRDDLTVGAFADAIESRVHALAQAQGLLRSNNWQDVWLSQVVQSVVESTVEDSHRIHVDWAHDILIPEQYVLSAALAVHELSRNSVEHGALATPSGRVMVSGTELDTKNVFQWVDIDGPEMSDGPLPKSGFGSLLLCTIWPDEMGGSATYELSDGGAVFRLVI